MQTKEKVFVPKLLWNPCESTKLRKDSSCSRILFKGLGPRTALQWHQACYFLWGAILAWRGTILVWGGTSSDSGGTPRNASPSRGAGPASTVMWCYCRFFLYSHNMNRYRFSLWLFFCFQLWKKLQKCVMQLILLFLKDFSLPLCFCIVWFLGIQHYQWKKYFLHQSQTKWLIQKDHSIAENQYCDAFNVFSTLWGLKWVKLICG